VRVVTVVVSGLADTGTADGGKTALEAAKLPTLDALATDGILGLTRLVPAGTAATTTATLLATLGHDVTTAPIAPAQAIALGLEADAGASRVGVLDLVTAGVDDTGREVVGGVGGSFLTRADRRALLDALRTALAERGVTVFSGTQAAVVLAEDGFVERTGPPWEMLGAPLAGADEDAALRRACRAAIENAPVIIGRRSGGAPVPTDVWVWGGGPPPGPPRSFPTSGIALADEPVAIGVAKFAGLETAPLDAPEDEGSWATSVPAIEAAIDKHAFTLLHVDAIDALGHRGDAGAKVSAIEALDQELLAPLVAALRSEGGDWRLAVVAGHVTSTTTRAHGDDAVPFVVYAGRPEHRSAHVRRRFHERDAREQGIFIADGDGLLGRLLRR